MREERDEGPGAEILRRASRLRPMGGRAGGAGAEADERHRRRRPHRRRWRLPHRPPHIIEGVWKPITDPSGDKLLPLIMGHENAGWVEEVGKGGRGASKVTLSSSIRRSAAAPPCLPPRLRHARARQVPRPRPQRRLRRASSASSERNIVPLPRTLAPAIAPCCRRRPHRLPRGEEGDPPPASRRDLRRHRRRRLRAHRHPVPEQGDVRGRRHRRRQVAGLPRARGEERRRQTGPRRRRRGRQGAGAHRRAGGGGRIDFVGEKGTTTKAWR